ncbi:MAG: dTMP kinase [Stellaceae bacterium]
MTDRRGRFITIEGGEGVGKSTQAGLLAAALERLGVRLQTTREPGGSPGAEAIRRLLLEGEGERWDGISEALLLVAARRDHVARLIAPALAQGNWVVSDRFADSTFAINSLNRAARDCTTRPDPFYLRPIVIALALPTRDAVHKTWVIGGAEMDLNNIVISAISVLLAVSGFLAVAEALGFLPQTVSRWLNRKQTCSDNRRSAGARARHRPPEEAPPRQFVSGAFSNHRVTDAGPEST